MQTTIQPPELLLTIDTQTSRFGHNPTRSDHLSLVTPLEELGLLPELEGAHRILSLSGSYSYIEEIALAQQGKQITIVDPTIQIREGQVYSYINEQREIAFYFFERTTNSQEGTVRDDKKLATIHREPAQQANQERLHWVSKFRNITLVSELPAPGELFDRIIDYWGLAGQLNDSDYSNYIYATSQLLSEGGKFTLAPIGRMTRELQEQLTAMGYTVTLHISNDSRTSFVEIVRTPSS